MPRNPVMPTPSPKISVVIPCYNYGRFLHDAICSVLRQELEAFEIIVVDDGSSDNTSEVAAAFGDRVGYIRTSNSGVSSARNLGASVATGDWVAFLDADDCWLPSKLHAQWTALQEQPLKRYSAVQCGYTVATSCLESRGPSVGVSQVSRREILLMKPQLTLVSSTLLIRRDVFAEIGGFNNDLATSADYELGLRLASRRELLSIPDCLVLYRVHGKQMHRNGSAFRREVDVILSAELAAECLTLRRRSRAAAHLVEMRLRWSSHEFAAAALCILRAVAQWPPAATTGVKLAVKRLRASLVMRPDSS